jgi:bifunctional non-homologous end joining protein LigD
MTAGIPVLSRDLPGSAADIVKALGLAGIEGVIAKRRDSTYQTGERSNDWVKFKLERQQEFVIGGYRPDKYALAPKSSSLRVLSHVGLEVA